MNFIKKILSFALVTLFVVAGLQADCGVCGAKDKHARRYRIGRNSNSGCKSAARIGEAKMCKACGLSRDKCPCPKGKMCTACNMAKSECKCSK